MAAVSVGTTAVQVTEPFTEIQHLGTADVWLGNDNTVSSSNGVKLQPNGVYVRPIGWSSKNSSRTIKPVWAKAASGTQDLRTIN